MDSELIDYIITYYSQYFTLKEEAANRHHISQLKSEDKEDPKHRKLIMKHWGTNNKEVLKLILLKIHDKKYSFCMLSKQAKI